MIQKLIVGFIGIILLGSITAYFFRDSIPFLSGLGASPISSARYVCDLDKTIEASVYEGKVTIKLSDGRNLTLPQLISASGVRYGNEDQSFVFWMQGERAFVTEGAQANETYTHCEIAVPGEEARSTAASSTMGVSFKYPRNFTLSAAYQYTGFPNKPINGLKILIPEGMATGTNLSSVDTGVSVEQLPRALNCSADIFMVANVRAETVAENGVTYSVASSSGAAAGNRYEEIVYAFPGSRPCTAVRYFIHSTEVGNYPEGTIREFDRAALVSEFNRIRDSVRITPASTQ